MWANVLIPVLVDALTPVLKDAVSAPQDAGDADARAKEAAETAAQAVENEVKLLIADAASQDRFRSWWRPAFGWVCVFAVAYEFLIRTMLTPLVAYAGAAPMPSVPAEALWPLVGGLLGIASLRTYEKKANVAESAGAVLSSVIKGAIQRAGK